MWQMWQRFEIGLATPLGEAFVLLLALWAAVSLVYAWMLLRSRGESNRALALAESCAEVQKQFGQRSWSQWRMDFFGLVATAKDGAALCAVLPELGGIEASERYARAQIGQCTHKPLFAYLARSSGKMQTLAQYLLDSALSKDMQESLCLELCRQLAKIHASGVYHGFVSPGSCVLSQDRVELIHSCAAYAIGPQAMQKRIQQVESQKAGLERLTQRELSAQLAYLAPEQRQGRASASCDFYSYAATCCCIFSSKPFTGAASVDWQTVPAKWHSFLRACLVEEASKRPKDFLELQDRLYDPELALNAMEEVPAELPVCETASLKDVASAMKRVMEPEMLDSDVRAGLAAIDTRRYNEARSHFKHAEKKGHSSADLQLGWALLFHYEGDSARSEKAYEQCLRLDPAKAARFHKTIALR